MTKTVTVQAQQRWDYCLETRKTENALLITANDLGQHGWELVNVIHYRDIRGDLAWTAFLKRPSAAQAPPPGQHAAATVNAAPAVQAVRSASSPGFDLSGDEFELKTETPQPEKQDNLPGK